MFQPQSDSTEVFTGSAETTVDPRFILRLCWQPITAAHLRTLAQWTNHGSRFPSSLTAKGTFFAQPQKVKFVSTGDWSGPRRLGEDVIRRTSFLIHHRKVIHR
ncbi:hypothetical protein INR49_008391 [Caranx melampygus]|nr:hypothetical protein INR49_008391 [Caranx melampygus]